MYKHITADELLQIDGYTGDKTAECDKLQIYQPSFKVPQKYSSLFRIIKVQDSPSYPLRLTCALVMPDLICWCIDNLVGSSTTSCSSSKFISLSTGSQVNIMTLDSLCNKFSSSPYEKSAYEFNHHQIQFIYCI